ncbi:metal ABC transporter substrate-binding protein [Nigerium massiliense]|uniref:metal ABC transporter substrate-binding protein n=1 Tax=Nigerium massiliense TaxID=1522317 RepID=UPI000693DAA1|nr:metal ABC transporter substrate-binding protein [Nigerium massiliense]
MRRTASILSAAALVLSGCTASPGDAPVAVATTTPLGSIVHDITACAGGTSATLMGPGDDPHTFSVSSRQVAEMVRAKLVVSNGLGLEEGLTPALDNVRRDGGRVYEVGPKVDPIPFAEHAHDEAHAQGGEEHGTYDPHVWLDAKRMAKAATAIGTQLKDATGDARYTRCATEVSAKLTETDATVRSTLQAVPKQRRTLVTDHDAMGYFADAYGFTVVGVVVPGGSTDAEPSSAELAAIVATVRRTGVPAIFSNTAVSPKLVESVAQETGRGVRVVPLYVGSVGPQGSGAETYAGMMTKDAEAVAGALK